MTSVQNLIKSTMVHMKVPLRAKMTFDTKKTTKKYSLHIDKKLIYNVYFTIEFDFVQ